MYGPEPDPLNVIMMANAANATLRTLVLEMRDDTGSLMRDPACSEAAVAAFRSPPDSTVAAKPLPRPPTESPSPETQYLTLTGHSSCTTGY